MNQSLYLRKKKHRKKGNDDERSQKDEICPLLIEGKCPNGISGKGCRYQHKKMCRNYCSFGSKDMHKAGCRFGEKCKYLHPKLCQNSVTMKMCLNEDCKLTHLKYTKRQKSNDRFQSDYFKGPVAQRENTNSYS